MTISLFLSAKEESIVSMQKLITSSSFLSIKKSTYTCIFDKIHKWAEIFILHGYLFAVNTLLYGLDKKIEYLTNYVWFVLLMEWAWWHKSVAVINQFANIAINQWRRPNSPLNHLQLAMVLSLHPIVITNVWRAAKYVSFFYI